MAMTFLQMPKLRKEKFDNKSTVKKNQDKEIKRRGSN